MPNRRATPMPDLLAAPDPPRDHQAAKPSRAPADEQRSPAGGGKARLSWNIDPDVEQAVRAIFDDHRGTGQLGHYHGWSEFGEMIVQRFIDEVERTEQRPAGRSRNRFPPGPQAAPRRSN